MPTWYLAICQDCDPKAPVPFEDPAQRNEWARLHRETGHRVEVTEEARAHAQPAEGTGAGGTP